MRHISSTHWWQDANADVPRPTLCGLPDDRQSIKTAGDPVCSRCANHPRGSQHPQWSRTS